MKPSIHYLYLLILVVIVTIGVVAGLKWGLGFYEGGKKPFECEYDIFLYCQGKMEWNTECGPVPDCSQIIQLPDQPELPEPVEPSPTPPSPTPPSPTPSNACTEACQSQPERFASGTCRSSRLYVDGEHIMANGQPVHLAGACFGPMWDVDTGTPGLSVQANKKMIENAADDGANFIYISLNLKLWSDPKYDNEQYRKNVDDYVQWCVDNDLFFAVRIHNCRYRKEDVFSWPGENWKIAANPTWRARAIQMLVDIAEEYKDLPNFVGISPITEPTDVDDCKDDYKHWDLVTQFYIDTIDEVTKVDPNSIFFLQAPCRPSGYPKEWVKKGFIDRDNIVLEYHQYYYHRLQWPSKEEEWATIYAEQGPKEGKIAYKKWLSDNIVSVRKNYKIPIFCGEFGVHLSDVAGDAAYPDDPYWKKQNTDKLQLFDDYDIHYTQFRLYAHVNAGHNFAMCTSDGSGFNVAGQNWADNLPCNLIRPSDLEGECEIGEEPIEYGCDPGVTCCCSPLSKLHIEGTEIKNENGQTVYLRGVNRPSLEWNKDGVHWVESDWENTASWCSNVVRLPFNMEWMIEDEDYQDRVEQAIQWGEKYGMYTILDCHGVGMPSPKADWLDMWEMLATKYKNRNSVLFDIFNEPKKGEDDEWFSWSQEAIDVIRATGAENIIIVGGKSWCTDVTELVDSPLSGGNIIISLHLYMEHADEITELGDTEPFLEKRGWKDLLENNVLFMVGEFNAYREDQLQLLWLEEFLGIMEDWGLSYTAWAYFPYPAMETGLIKDDWETPTIPGEIVRDHLCATPTSTTSVVLLHKTKYNTLRDLVDYDKPEPERYENLEWYAKNFDSITTDWWSIKTSSGWLEFLPRMHAVNPDLEVLLYWNVPNRDEKASDYEMLLEKGWILKDKDGNVVSRKGKWPSLKATDIGNPEYREWLANKLKEYTSSEHVYGVMGDNTATSAKARYVTTPINPRTGKEYTDEEYTNDMVKLIEEVKRVTGKLYIGLGYGTATGGCPWTGYHKHKENAEKIINAVDGVALEGYIRWGSHSTWMRSVEQWIQDIEYVDYLVDKNKIVGVWTITSGDNPPASAKEIAMYGFTSYLLVARGGYEKAYFTARGYDKAFRLLVGDLDVGRPLENYHIRGDVPVYEREFSNVLVLVNPNDRSYTVSLGKKYKTLDGREVSSITLDDHSGEVLKVITTQPSPQPSPQPEPPPSTMKDELVNTLEALRAVGFNDPDGDGSYDDDELDAAFYVISKHYLDSPIENKQELIGYFDDRQRTDGAWGYYHGTREKLAMHILQAYHFLEAKPKNSLDEFFKKYNTWEGVRDHYKPYPHKEYRQDKYHLVACWVYYYEEDPPWLDKLIDFYQKDLSWTTGEDMHERTHILFSYILTNRPFPNPDDIIDTTLIQQNPDGSWTQKYHSTLHETVVQASFLSMVKERYPHRAEDIQEAIDKSNPIILSKYRTLVSGGKTYGYFVVSGTDDIEMWHLYFGILGAVSTGIIPGNPII